MNASTEGCLHMELQRRRWSLISANETQNLTLIKKLWRVKDISMSVVNVQKVCVNNKLGDIIQIGLLYCWKEWTAQKGCWSWQSLSDLGLNRNDKCILYHWHGRATTRRSHHCTMILRRRNNQQRQQSKDQKMEKKLLSFRRQLLIFFDNGQLNCNRL